MFGDWKWGEHVAGAREEFSLSFLGWCQADMVEVEGGWWWLLVTSRLLVCSCSHILCTLRMPRQLVQTLLLLLVLGLQWKCETSVGDAGPHCWHHCYSPAVEVWCFLFVAYVQTNVLATLGRRWSNSSFYALEIETMILQLSTCIWQIWI